MSRLLYFPSVILLIFFVSGCLQSLQITDYSRVYKDGLDYSNPKSFLDYDNSLHAYGDPSQNSCKEGRCYCFACQKKTSFYNLRESYFGRCEARECFVNADAARSAGKDPTADQVFVFDDILKGAARGDWRISNFLIGHGTTFIDFSEASRYCEGSLGMSVRWLVGDERTPYALPSEFQTGCYQKMEVLPLYILYSEGKNINIPRTIEIAKALKDKGPVIITTEIDFNGADATTANLIRQQIEAIDRECPNCLVALAPKMGDKSSVLAVLGIPSTSNAPNPLADKVDIVAYGINTRYSKTPRCTVPDIYNEALQFSKSMLYTYKKPTLIAYMLFAAGQNNNPSFQCQWTAQIINSPGVENPYSYFFSNMIPAFQSKGVLGAAPYGFTTSFDPLKCGENCLLGLHLRNPQLTKNKQSFDKWFGWCSAYVKEIEKSTSASLRTSTGEYLSVYNDAPGGGSCSFLGRNYKPLFQTAYEGKDITKPRDHKVRDFETENGKKAPACGGCSYDIAKGFPQDVKLVAVSDPNPNFCTDYETEITRNAGGSDVDPMIMRAIIWQESAFDKCAASEVRSGEACYDFAYNEMPDTAGVCTKTRKPGVRYCAFGLMQTLVSPEPNWNSVEFERTKRNGRGAEGFFINQFSTLCKGEDGSFNPFDEKDNACMGVNQFEYYLNIATGIVNKKTKELGLERPGGTKDESKARIYSTYIALRYYNGLGSLKSPYGGITLQAGNRESDSEEKWNQLILLFDYQKTGGISACSGAAPPDYCRTGKPASCIGQKDFVTFTRECATNGDDYGSLVLARYNKLNEKCDNAICKTERNSVLKPV